MTQDKFVLKNFINDPDNGEFCWESPSNIALVKYWGKNNNQIPKNSSISFTLNKCVTITTLKFNKKSKKDNALSFQVYYDNKLSVNFRPKIRTFLDRILIYCPFLSDYDFDINTVNSFPHSSGIASSASGMSALALCIMSIERLVNPKTSDEYFYNKASFLARLGSGSACRSVSGSINLWGKHDSFSTSSDLFSISYPKYVDPIFFNYHDAILLVDKGKKVVSSTLGHELMNNHVFSTQRFELAQNNIDLLSVILETGNIDEFIELVESEALMLHGLMMTSDPSYILLKPNTIEIINRVQNYRKSNHIPICFTLDAGANLHLLFPDSCSENAYKFIDSELKYLCENNSYIKDTVGFGAKQL
jgi:diphosphomevalonate decarboxylase